MFSIIRSLLGHYEHSDIGVNWVSALGGTKFDPADLLSFHIT